MKTKSLFFAFFGIALFAIVAFKNDKKKLPELTIPGVVSITQSTAQCRVTVFNDGGAGVTARGVCWSTSQKPTIADNHTNDGAGIGSFVSSIAGLNANTSYYMRAYATNSAGTSYGDQIRFTTWVVTCMSNITDGCLDDWMTFNSFGNDYFNPAGGFLQSLNELAALPAAAGGPGPMTVDTVRDCVQGIYAAKLVSGSFNPLGSPIFIPGYIGSSVLDIPNATIYLGKPYTLRPERFQGYYKYSPVGGDSALVQVMLSRYNSGAGKRDTLSFDRIIIHSAVPVYTQIDFPLNYLDTLNTPDTLILVFASSAGVNFQVLDGSHGQVGSTMWVDDLKFVFPTVGVDENKTGNLDIFPNPNDGMFTISLPSEKNYLLKIFNALGALIYNTRSVGKKQLSIQLENARPGIYYLMMEGDKETKTSKIFIQ
jgi:hypothetical protein